MRAPRSGTLLIDCGFVDLDAGSGDGVSWWIDRDDGTEIASGRLINDGDSGVLRLPPQFTQAGERIHFLIGAGDTAQNDTTRLRTTVELVPTDAHIGTDNVDDTSYIGIANGTMWPCPARARRRAFLLTDAFAVNPRAAASARP